MRLAIAGLRRLQFSLSSASTEIEVGPTQAAVPGTQGHATGSGRAGELPSSHCRNRKVRVDSSPQVFITHSIARP